MAEPTTIWGREAVQGITDVKSGVADANRRLEAVEGKLDGLLADLAEFRGTVRGIGSASKSSFAVAASFHTIVKRMSQRLASPAWYTGYVAFMLRIRPSFCWRSRIG